MSALKHSELFDFDRYTAEIKNVQQVTLDFGTTVDSVLARVGAQQKALTAQLKDYAAALKNFNVGSPGAGAGLTGFNTQVSNTARSMNDLKAIQQGLASVTNLQRASITQLEAEYKGLNAQLKNLVPGTQGYEAEVNRLRGRLAEVIPKLQAFSSAVTAQKKIIEGAEGSYRRMQAQLGFLRTQLRDMPGAFNASTGAINKNNKEAVALDREIKRLANTLGNADKQMALYHRNVGNYSSAFKGFGSGLLQYATTVLSLTTAFNVLNQSLDFSAKFQSLNTALRALSGSSEEFAQTQQFLSGLANKYGQDIFTVSNAYKQLSASTRGTNLAGVETKRIFESVVQAGTVLKLSNEEVEGSLLAISQMISKGKVSAEELRGQLGERLPGAFRVFADSLGVSTQKLDQMLKKGEVMAEDALPKFAKKLNELYGKQALDGATALVNETNRLNNAWAKFISGDKVAGFFADIKGGMATFLADLDFAIEKGESLWGFFQRGSGAGKNVITDKRLAAEKAAADVEAFLQNFESKTDKERAAALQARIQTVSLAQKKETEILEARRQAAIKNRISVVQEKQLELNQTRTFIAQQQELLTKQLAVEARLNRPVTGGGGTDDDGKAEERLRKFKARIAEEQRVLKSAYELDLKNLELQLAQKQISEREYETQKLELATTYAGAAYATEEKLGTEANKANLNSYKEFLADRKIEHEKFMQGVREREAARTERILTTDDPTKFTKKRSEFDIEATALPTALGNRAADAAKDVEAENKAFALIQAGRDTSFREELAHLNRLKQIRIDHAQSTAEEEYAIRQLEAERERALAQQTQELITQAITTALSSIKESFDAESDQRIAKLEAERDKEIELAGNNSIAKERIEKTFNDRVAREKRRQAQRDKLFSLFDVGINTAVGVTKSIAEWGMPFALPFIALTIGAGLIQAAAIAARPLPAFKKGTKNAPEGPAVVGEDGSELIERNGRFYVTPNKPTIVNLTGGETIHTHEQSKKIIDEGVKTQQINRELESSVLQTRAAHEIARGSEAASVERLTQALRRSGLNKDTLEDAFAGAIKNLPVNIFSFNERGYEHKRRERGDTIKYLNARHG